MLYFVVIVGGHCERRCRQQCKFVLLLVSTENLFAPSSIPISSIVVSLNICVQSLRMIVEHRLKQCLSTLQ